MHAMLGPTHRRGVAKPVGCLQWDGCCAVGWLLCSGMVAVQWDGCCDVGCLLCSGMPRSAGVCSLLWDVRRALFCSALSCLVLSCLALSCLALLCTHAKLVSHSFLTAMLWHNMCISARLGSAWLGLAWLGVAGLGSAHLSALAKLWGCGAVGGRKLWFDGWTAVI